MVLRQVHYPRESWVGEPASVSAERTYRCEHCNAENELKRTGSEWRAIDAALATG